MRDAFEAKRKRQKAKSSNKKIKEVDYDSDETVDELTEEQLKNSKKQAWFERYNANGGKKANPVGPWHRALNDTMFWM